MKKKNSVNKGFLKEYRNGKPNEIKYIPLSFGFIKLRYGYSDDPKNLSAASFVLDKNEYSPALGMTLEFSLNENGLNDTATYIPENGISGFQWSNGEVFRGHTYDDDTAPSNGRIISLED